MKSARVCPQCREPFHQTPGRHAPECSGTCAFWMKVEKSAECWTWRGTLAAYGYGRTTWMGRQTGTHRVSWEIHHGAIPDGLSVLHRCDNPPCVNPAHLFLGTQTDNMRDMTSKSRHAHQAHPETYPKGVRHWKARLTEEMVLSIRRRHARGETFADIAREVGISRATVSQAGRGQTWAHIKEAR